MITKLEDFIHSNRQFVEWEEAAEKEENKLLLESRSLNDLCKAGLALKKLKMLSSKTSVCGRYQVKFLIGTQSTNETSLKSHKFSFGDTVNLCSSGNHRETLASGVVAKFGENFISLAFDEWNEREIRPENRTFSLILTVNDVTFRRLEKTASDLEQFENFPGSNLVRYLFGISNVPDAVASSSKSETYFDNNPVAVEVVDFCIDDSRPISVIHGPPGTGKTTALVKIIQILVQRGRKILACAPSNVAVDNIVERLLEMKVKVVRMGHPARTQSNLRHCCLDHILKRSDQRSLINDIRNELDTLYSNRWKLRKEGVDLKTERKRLRKELVEREKLALRDILASVQVVCCTLTMASCTDSPLLCQFLNVYSSFDCVVIDECAQATELSCWGALLLGKRCILAGDHNQLSPTVVSPKASAEGFERTLLRRIVEEFNAAESKAKILRQLKKQFRMNELIMRWASKEMYEDQLEADGSVAHHLLNGLNNILEVEESMAPLMLIDTSDCAMNEISIADDQSKANLDEARLVYLHVERLISIGVNQEDIAVITPYNLQVHFLRLFINEKYRNVAIRSVDGFQGQEREAVILSMVRSNKKRELGFLVDRKRINVAVTRARRHFCLICDCDCTQTDRFIKSLIDHVRENGLVRSAYEYTEQLKNLSLNVDLSNLDIVEATRPQKPLPESSNKIFAAKRRPRADKRPDDVESFTEQTSMQSNLDGSAPHETDQPTGFYFETYEKMREFMEQYDTSVCEFPASLNSVQRKVVHEIAEQLNLHHVSSGSGANRRIRVEKLSDAVSIEGVEEDAKLASPAKTNVIPPIPSEKRKNTKKSQGVAKSSSKLNSSKPIENSTDEDALLNACFMERNLCKFSACGASTRVTGSVCSFCRFNFCLKHALAEIHGCGPEARKAARKSDAKYTISGGYVVAKRDSDKGQLADKLNKKIEDIRAQRLAKKTPP